MLEDGENMELNTMMSITMGKKKQTSVSSVSGLTPITDNTTSVSIIPCSEKFKLMRKTVQLEDKEQKKRINLYVKENVFQNLKFTLS